MERCKSARTDLDARMVVARYAQCYGPVVSLRVESISRPSTPIQFDFDWTVLRPYAEFTAGTYHIDWAVLCCGVHFADDVSDADWTIMRFECDLDVLRHMDEQLSCPSLLAVVRFARDGDPVAADIQVDGM